MIAVAAADRPTRLCAYSLGLLAQARVRRILALAGYRLTAGWPDSGDAVAVWGQRPVAARGRWVAGRTGAPLVSLEDGFLRSLRPGVTGALPLSLVIDEVGIYHDCSRPSRLEHLIADGPPDAEARARARAGRAALRAARLSKYTPCVPPRSFPDDHVLVVDQTRGDASIRGAGATAETFRRMLDAARAEHPNAHIVVKAHPDTHVSRKTGHLGPADLDAGMRLVTGDVNPWDLIEPARAVYTVSSQMGYEALLARKPVRCFGAAFYAGWGLTEDEIPTPRRTARPDIDGLFWACHLAYPIYYDPWRDRLAAFETVLDALTHQRRAETPCHTKTGEVIAGVRLWKRRNVMRFRPSLPRRARFAHDAGTACRIAAAEDRAVWVWASKASRDALDGLAAQGGTGGFFEDGFLRSVGLGAQLTEAASLVFDRQGIYFDPSGPSDLEDLIAAAAGGAADTARAARLSAMIVASRVTKYNVGQHAPAPPAKRRPVVLVPGQVEDDASIRRGCGEVRTNLALLQAARRANPAAWLIFKPHPDVEAGLRAGAIPAEIAAQHADEIACDRSAADLMDAADALWTLTSLMGFEALMRGLPVTCLGTPFYAGWGLTTDLGPPVARRTARPSLEQLVWAALIAYPSYRDPVSGLPCSPELIVERFASGVQSRRAGALSRLQGLFASQSWLWRR